MAMNVASSGFSTSAFKHAPCSSSVRLSESVDPLPTAAVRIGASKCVDCKAHKKAFCAKLEGDELDAIGAIAMDRDFDAGDTLFTEADEATSYYTVRSGCVRLSRLLPDGKRQITGFRMPGDFIGYEIDGTYTCDAEAIVPTTVCKIPRSKLDLEIDASSKLQSQLLMMMKTGLVMAEEHNLLLGRKTPVSKLCSFFAELLKRNQTTTEIDTIELLMSRSDIADYLGLTIETVSRTFTKLRCQQVIDLPTSNCVTICDREMLMDLAVGM